MSIVGAALILFVLVAEYQPPSASVALIDDRSIMTTMLSDDDGINGDINRQAKKLIQRAAQEKAHAAQENKKGADLVTKAERTCKIAEVSSPHLLTIIIFNDEPVTSSEDHSSTKMCGLCT